MAPFVYTELLTLLPAKIQIQQKQTITYLATRDVSFFRRITPNDAPKCQNLTCPSIEASQHVRPGKAIADALLAQKFHLSPNDVLQCHNLTCPLTEDFSVLSNGRRNDLRHVGICTAHRHLHCDAVGSRQLRSDKYIVSAAEHSGQV